MPNVFILTQSFNDQVYALFEEAVGTHKFYNLLPLTKEVFLRPQPNRSIINFGSAEGAESFWKLMQDKHYKIMNAQLPDKSPMKLQARILDIGVYARDPNPQPVRLHPT